MCKSGSDELVPSSEIVAGTLSPEGERVFDIVRGPALVLISAHDEGRGILPMLADVKAQLKSGDRLLVVADNCWGDTAEIAESAGAKVVRREDPRRRGKSFAPRFWLQSLSEKRP